MITITLLSVGKTKEQWLDQAIEEYRKRLQPYAKFNFHLVKDNRQLEKALAKISFPIFLDPEGDAMDSPAFSAFLLQKLEDAGSRPAFVIGGAEGLPLHLKKGQRLISLSKMTFTHQISRLILMEQTYRAFEIAKGSAYHK